MPSLREYPDGLSLSHQNWRLGDGDRRGAAGRMSAAQGWRAQGLNHSCRPGLPLVITPILTSLGSGGLPGEKGSMTPFPGRAGAAAHPKVKRQPPFPTRRCPGLRRQGRRSGGSSPRGPSDAPRRTGDPPDPASGAGRITCTRPAERAPPESRRDTPHLEDPGGVRGDAGAALRRGR